MIGSSILPSLDALKGQAKRLRTKMAADGTPISHSRSLELLAHQQGYRDWNTLYAAAGNQQPGCPVSLGQRVTGRYLNQSFSGTVLSVRTLGQGNRYRVTFQFDEPVDVVTFDSFSSFRHRVSCNINGQGTTLEKTSDGRPQLSLDL